MVKTQAPKKQIPNKVQITIFKLGLEIQLIFESL